MQDSSVVFAVYLDLLNLSLTRLLLNKRTQVFWFRIFTWLTHSTFKMAFVWESWNPPGATSFYVSTSIWEPHLHTKNYPFASCYCCARVVITFLWLVIFLISIGYLSTLFAFHISSSFIEIKFTFLSVFIFYI